MRKYFKKLWKITDWLGKNTTPLDTVRLTGGKTPLKIAVCNNRLHVFWTWGVLHQNGVIPSLKNSEQSSEQMPCEWETLGEQCCTAQVPELPGASGSAQEPPTLHVKDRVQGFLVSRSMTPQWMSGSNSLSVKSTQTLQWAQTLLHLFWK